MKTRNWVYKIIFLLSVSLIPVFCLAQNPVDSLPGDPGGISVYNVQDMCFGAFSQGGTGGTISVATDGTRSVSGSVLQLNLGTSYFQSIFEIDAAQGTIISILNGPDATLTGSNGGTMNLHLSNSSPASPFSTTVSQPARTQVSIGGTLTVGNTVTTPPGSYSGTFSVTFNYQ